MILLLPIKWIVIQCMLFLVMVAIEAAILHYIEGVAKRDSIIYLFLVNLFSFNFGWLIVSLTFYLFEGTNIQDDILGYMLLGIVSEKLLADIAVNPFSDPLLPAMVLYFGAIFYFELKALTLLRTFVLPTGEQIEDIDLKLPQWADRLLVVVLSKDLRLIMTVFIANFVSHTVAGILIFITQS
ncbi:hypothetical protein [[Limnothrix rosea] IAM M-220]|uniref:hypothetical protein n=1 Tax=[Limnothrix rosea] IAM M-220 TaxID=454133 RepID=UPI0009679927|nr:hypothetical protein [[Limnothrix rosea] IAM M-220]OKH12515.1 hypothetical protein NIES208_15950 [[Limnothrix rosea] IAM M-220]